IGGGYAALDAGRVAAKGEPISVVETMERLTQGQEVVFQETRMRSLSVPILGTIAWYSDQGKGSTINSLDQLDRFYWMQDQDAKLPEEKKEEEKKPEPQGVTIYALGGVQLSVDQLGGSRVHVGDRVSLETHEHRTNVRQETHEQLSLNL
ncbi:MAG: hypothetical protein AB1758_25625, partial [Candidatus Eremiobacterota bacterium]